MIALWLLGCSVDVDQPQPINWDHEACDECGMMVSDPTFAAELVTTEGQLETFDDPGCLFRYILDHQPHIAHVWFHDGTSDRWLDSKEVRFVPATGAPMNGGFQAVPDGTPGAIGFAEASSRVLAGS